MEPARPCRHPGHGLLLCILQEWQLDLWPRGTRYTLDPPALGGSVDGTRGSLFLTEICRKNTRAFYFSRYWNQRRGLAVCVYVCVWLCMYVCVCMWILQCTCWTLIGFCVLSTCLCWCELGYVSVTVQALVCIYMCLYILTCISKPSSVCSNTTLLDWDNKG